VETIKDPKNIVAPKNFGFLFFQIIITPTKASIRKGNVIPVGAPKKVNDSGRVLLKKYLDTGTVFLVKIIADVTSIETRTR